MFESVTKKLTDKEIRIIKSALKQADEMELLKKLKNKQILIREKLKYE